MDEAALRAMMPMSFGKKAPKKGPVKQPPPPTPAARSSNDTAPLATSILGKRPAVDPEEAEDDGLTPEERRANAEAERRQQERRAQGLASDSDSSSDDSDSEDDVGPPAPPSTSAAQRETIVPPMSNSALLTGTHSKTISALAVDPSGARFALGSYDYNLSLYDFGGMSSSLSPFRLFEPAENYPVLDLSFSSNSTNLLVVTGTAQAKLFSRDGADLSECKKGDPYLRDMRNTTGHVSGLTCGLFTPYDSGKFVTGGSDSSIRLWDVESMQRGQTDVIVMKSKLRGGRTKVSALQCTTGHTLIAGGQDGSLGYWDLRANLNSKPRGSVEKAHGDAGATSIAVSEEMVATRGSEGTVKLWDLRSFRQPLATKEGLPNGSPHTSIRFDPFDSKTVLTCTSDAGSKEGGELVVLDALNSLSTLHTYTLPSSPIRLHWSVPTDQLFITSRTSLSIFYSPSRSSKGILLPLSRAPKTTSSSLYTSASSSTEDSYPIYNSSDLAAGGQSESAKRRKLAKARQDPIATRMPQAPVSGPGKGGRIGAAATQHVVQSIYGGVEREDPREALLRYASKEEGGEGRGKDVEFTKAWEKTQPKTLYSKYTDDDDGKKE